MVTSIAIVIVTFTIIVNRYYSCGMTADSVSHNTSSALLHAW